MSTSENTPSRMWLDVGTLLVDGTDIGATEQEGSFAIEQEIYKPRLGGTRGPVAEISKVITESATIMMNLVEMTVANLVRILPTVTSTSDANSEYTVLEDFGYVAASEYVTVVWDGETFDQSEVLIKLYNALVEGGLSANMSDTAESQTGITWRSHYALATPKQRNWQMFVAK